MNTESSLLQMFGVPKRYLDKSFECFEGGEGAAKIIDSCREYKNGSLILQGNSGIGKTHLAVSILKSRLEAEKLPCNRQLQKANFITAPNLLLEIRSAFSPGSTKTEKQIVDYYSQIPFLIIDDLGSEKTTEFSITTLYIIIDHRDSELMDTIITTNLSLQSIEYKLSARIASRLAGMKIINIDMPDYRKKRV